MIGRSNLDPKSEAQARHDMARLERLFDPNYPWSLMRLPERVWPIYTSRCIDCGSADLGLDAHDRVICQSTIYHKRRIY